MDVWNCPYCARQALQKKARETRARLNDHRGPVVLATFTITCDAGESLVVIVGRLKSGLRLLKRGGSWSRITKAAGLVGSVQVIEITHSDDQGWSAHAHELFFIRRGVLAFRRSVYARWSDVADARADVRTVKRTRDDIERVIDYALKGARPHADALGGRNGAAVLADAQAGDPGSQGLAQEMAFALKGVHRTAGRLPTR